LATAWPIVKLAARWRGELVERVQELDDAVRHDARARRPIGAAGMPTLLRPVRYTLWPGVKDERPAVQLCSVGRPHPRG